jgi:hypothetical protein
MYRQVNVAQPAQEAAVAINERLATAAKYDVNPVLSGQLEVFRS